MNRDTLRSKSTLDWIFRSMTLENPGKCPFWTKGDPSESTWSSTVSLQELPDVPGGSQEAFGRPFGASEGRDRTPEGLVQMEDFRCQVDLDRRGSRFIAHLSFCSQDGKRRQPDRPQEPARLARPQTSQTEQTDRPDPRRPQTPVRQTDGLLAASDGRPGRLVFVNGKEGKEAADGASRRLRMHRTGDPNPSFVPINEQPSWAGRPRAAGGPSVL